MPKSYLTVDDFRAGTASALLSFSKKHGLTVSYNPPGITTGYAARLPRSSPIRRAIMAALETFNTATTN
jgi:hypothetical protein